MTRPGSRAAWLSASLAVLAAAGPAAAQEGSIIEVRNRPHPEYDPTGARVGSFVLYPRLDLTGNADDNIYAASTDRTADVDAVVRGGARLASQWSRHRLDLEAHAAAIRHARRTSEDSEAAGASADGRFDISRTALATLRIGFDRQAEDRLNVNALRDTLGPITYRELTVDTAATKEFGRLRVTGGGQYLRETFDDGRLANGALLSQAYRDVTVTSAAGTAAYEFGGGASLVATATYDQVRYDDTLGFVDRDSHGLRAEAGVALPLTPLISGEVKVGYLTRHNAFRSFRDTDGVSFSANILWNPTTLVSARLLLNRTIEPNSSTFSPGNLRSEGTLLVDYELLRRLILTTTVRVADIEQIATSAPHSQEYDAALGATYHIDRRFQVNARIRHFARTAGVTPNVVANVFSLGTAITF